MNIGNKFSQVSRAVASLAILLSSIQTAGATGINIIDSTYGTGAGSFELGSFVADQNHPDFVSLGIGSTAIAGWTVGGGPVDVAWLNGSNPVASIYAVDTGTKAVNLPSGSTIATTIPTVVGNVYQLSFAAAGPPSYFYPSWGDVGKGVVSAGTLVGQEFTGPYSNAPYYTQWQTFLPFQFLFTALGPSTTIQFTGENPDQGTNPYNYSYGPIIDSVSVNLASPIPAAIWMVGSALVGLVGFVLREPT